MSLKYTIMAVIYGEIVVLPYILGFFLVGLVFGAKKTDWKELKLNVSYWPIWVVGNLAVATLLHLMFIDNLREWASSHAWALSVSSLHPALLALLNLFVFDVFYYWYHRTEHKTALWHYHEVHHADPAMNATTAYRHHFLENLIRVPFVDLPLMFLLVGAAANPNLGIFDVVATALVGYLGVFAHSNLRIGFGPLSWLIISPQVHRIHHSREVEHFDRNFAAYFPFIDVIFGTYHHPAKGEWPETGLSNIGRTLDTPLKMILYPFKAWNLRAGISEPLHHNPE